MCKKYGLEINWPFSIFIERLLKAVCRIELIQYDYETTQPIRDDNGRCIPVTPGMYIYNPISLLLFSMA